MSEPVIRVIDGRHQVGVTENGIDWRPVGEPFGAPRAAIDFADRFADPTTSAGNPVPAPDAVARYAADVRADAGRGGLIPPGSPRPAPARPEADHACDWPGCQGQCHTGSTCPCHPVDAVPTPSGGVDSQQPAPLGTRADRPGTDPGTHPPGV